MTITPSKICAIIAAVLFLLAALGLGLGPIDTISFGLFFLALAFVV